MSEDYGFRRRPFGYLLTLDLYDCAAGVCDDLALCYDFLETLVARLGVEKQAPPFVFRSPTQFADKAGLSGWVPLIESSITIHTLTVKDFVSVDIYCCRQIDRDAMLEVASKMFGPSNYEFNEIERGLKYHEAR